MRARHAAPPGAPADRRQSLPAAVLVLSGLLAYANAIQGPFIFDDYTAILDNARVRELWPPSSPLSPPRDTPVAGRPLVNLSLAINYAMAGYDVRAYHATNLAIHVLASLVLFGVVRRTIARGPDASPLHAHATAIALVSALVWLLHPLQTEVVNYTTQRTTSLKALMMLLTLYCSVRALDHRPGRWHVAAVVACAAGMACKESMVTTPILILLFDRVFVFASLRDAFAARRGLYAGLASTWLVLAALLVGAPRSTVGFDAEIGAWTYLLNQTRMIVRYLRLSVWPRGLVYDYGLPQPLGLADVALPAVAVSALALATLVSLRRWPRIGFLGAWFFITLAPTSSIVPIVTEVGAERRMYMPLAAMVVLAVSAAAHIPVRGRLARPVAATVCVAACLLLAAGTVSRNREYQSRLTLARTAVDRRPHGRNYFRLGVLLVEAGQRAEGIEYFRLAKGEDFVGARFALGLEHMADGNLPAAQREFAEFVRRNPDHNQVVEAREMLGRSFMVQGRLDAAIDQYTLILRDIPAHVVAHEAVGDIRLAQGRVAEALPHLEFVATRQRTDVAALGKFGTALAATGRVGDAIVVFSRVVATDPGNVDARNMLGRTLARQGRLAEAIEQFERAIALAPNDGQAHDNLRQARAQLAHR